MEGGGAKAPIYIPSTQFMDMNAEHSVERPPTSNHWRVVDGLGLFGEDGSFTSSFTYSALKGNINDTAFCHESLRQWNQGQVPTDT